MVQTVTGNLVEVSSPVRIEIFNGVFFRIFLSKTFKEDQIYHRKQVHYFSNKGSHLYKYNLITQHIWKKRNQNFLLVIVKVNY